MFNLGSEIYLGHVEIISSEADLYTNITYNNKSQQEPQVMLLTTQHLQINSSQLAISIG